MSDWSVKKYMNFLNDMGYDLYDGSLDKPLEKNVKFVDKDGNVRDEADESFFSESYICKRRNYPIG